MLARDRCSGAERQLIVLSAGTAARRGQLAAHAERLAGEVDWPRLAATLRARGLLTVLGPRMLRLAEAHGGGQFAEGVRGALVARRHQSTFLHLLASRLVSLLGEGGIRCSPLKGPQLGERIYGEQGCRPSSDVDLLVAADQLPHAVDVVRALGYARPADELDSEGLPLLHLALVHERGELPPVELHWRIHWYEPCFAGERLLAPSVHEQPGWRPAPRDELAALLLFYARDGFVDLRLAADLGAWWDTYGDTVAPGALTELICAYPALGRALATSAAVAERHVGLPARRLLHDAPQAGWRERAATRLANPNANGSRAQLYADIGVIDALLMPRGGLRAFVARQVLPSKAVLEARAGAGRPRRGVTRTGHAVRVLTRYALTIARLLRRPETFSAIGGSR
jgi:hypothetical protein